MIDAKSFKTIFLENWMPALITALVGGLLVAYLAPMIQTRFAESSVLKKRQLELWESIGENFTNYIIWRSRLNTAARAEASPGSVTRGKEFLERKERYITERDRYANLLRRDLLFAPHYFKDPKVSQTIDEFLKWHAQFATAPVEKLPPDEEYIGWRDRLMETIRSTAFGGLS